MAIRLRRDSPAPVVAVAEPLAQEAFQRLYRAAAGPVLGYLIAGCGRRDVAEDLLQETFCRLLVRWPSLGPSVTGPAADPQALHRYLFRIATNLLHDRWRSGAGEPFADPPDQGAAPNLDVAVDIQAMLRRLRPRERELLWLACVEDMDHGEIAAATGLSRLSVRTLLFRARAKARQMLSRQGVPL
ncbi:MAG TPA: RNA polymerase sigma factor [Acidobacteriaceae bacterium]|nr:RNA polymerase sigma factor [Acidobacteriaceae bacterium]